MTFRQNNSEPNTDYLHEFFPVYRGLKVERYFGDHWCMHLPFAYELMRELKPKVFVELGVWKGESYFTFCQSVTENGLDTKCFGVDTWAGDIHMGAFAPDLGEEVAAYNQRYAAFSHLKKMRFLDAAKDFADGSIHLLHMDGEHRYENIKEDFDTWLPKVADGGVILFHDVEVRDRDFGVWKLWGEIAQLGASFVFTFGHGLAVWKKGPPSGHDPELLRRLFGADAKERLAINRHYLSLGLALQSSWKLDQLQAASASKDEELSRLEADLESKDEEIGCLEFEVGNLLAENKELNRAVGSAIQWQRRSWFTRSFHRWRAPGSGKKTKLAFLHKLKSSICNGRKLLWSKTSDRADKNNRDPQIEPCGERLAAVSLPANCTMPKGYAETIRFGLVLPVHSAGAGRLKAILEAISNQSYRNWRLWVLDEGGNYGNTLNLLQDYAAADDRITVLSGKIHSNAVNFPEIPSDIDSDCLLLLQGTAALPPGFLVARFIEIQGLGPTEPALSSSSFAVRLFVREDSEANHLQVTPPRVRAIAFFLPQFHAIPENDAWWGKGFTEWTNVKRAFPLYPGHNQPRIPHPDIGYYNLLDSDVKERQAKMASRYGIHGFCYYFYWFGGRRILEKPLEQILHSGSPKFPFCLCWANENWSKRWDGGNSEILLKQHYSPEDDVAMIRCAMEYFRDPRYIRVNGKPLFIIYRPSLLPDPKATFARWRQVCREEGVGEIYLCSTRTFSIKGPGDTGVDAMIQFPPHGVPGLKLKRIPRTRLNADPAFSGTLLNFDDYRMGYLADTNESFKLFRGVMPSWDNTPRRLYKSTIVHGASLKKYYWWLSEAVRQTEAMFKGDERLVFINAWNEWAEGAYLEPDKTHGYRTLEATRRALHFPIPSGWREVLNNCVASQAVTEVR